MPKAVNSFVFLDFETGGLDPRSAAITEVAMVAIKGDTLEKIDLVSTFIKPYGADEVSRNNKIEREYGYHPDALKHTGITMAEIEAGQEIGEVVNEIIVLLEKSNFTPRNKGSKPILVAHNSAFDKGFLIQLFTVCNKMKELERLTYGNIDFFGNYQPEMFDSIMLAKLAWGNDDDMTNFKLESCVTKAGIELNDAHRGINDTLAMKDMVCVLANKLRSENGGEGKVVQRIRNHFQF